MSRRLALSALPLTVLLGGIGGGMLVLSNSRHADAQDPARLTAPERATAASLENAFMRVADTAGPATVSIEVKMSAPFFNPLGGRGAENPAEMLRTGSGSGLIVRSDGYILTNDHVVEGAVGGKARVKLADGQSFEGTVVRDPQSDLALIKIDAKKPLPAMTFADSDKLHVGQWAIAIGSPFGQENSMTTGIVSALHRKSIIGGFGSRRTYPSLIQTDAAINQGNSGGPLLNINGEVIGVNVALYSPTGTSAGIGFAIPANTARSIVEQLISRGKVTRGFLGVMLSDPTPAEKKLLGEGIDGVIVRRVSEDTPAAKAGLEEGDLIVAFDGKPVSGEIGLREAIGMTPPGKQVSLKVQRDKEEKTLSVTLGEAPATPVPSAKPPSESALTRFGLRVQPLTDGERKAFSTLPGSGVIVSTVLDGSPAADAGLSVGMVLLTIGGVKIGTIAEAEAALAKIRGGEPVLIRTLKKSGTGTVSSVRTLTAPPVPGP